MINLDELKAIAEKATKGPWMKCCHGQEIGGPAGNNWWSVNKGHFDGRVLNAGGQVCRVMSTMGEDAAFIAAANPAVVLEIIATVEAQAGKILEQNQSIIQKNAEIERLHEALDKARNVIAAMPCACSDTLGGMCAKCGYCVDLTGDDIG